MSQQNYPFKSSYDDSKTEIISIRKKLPNEYSNQDNQLCFKNTKINNDKSSDKIKNISNMNMNIQNTTILSFQNDTIRKIFPNRINHSPGKSEISKTNFQKNEKKNFNQKFSKSSTNLCSSQNTLNNINSKLSDEKVTYVTQSQKNCLPDLIENIHLNNSSSKYSIKSWNSINKMFNKRNQGFYCPHCEHCNKIEDENLDKYMAMKEAKNVIQKGFEFICEYYGNDQNFLDLLINLKPNTNLGTNNLNNKINKNKEILNNSEYNLSNSNINKFNNNEQISNKSNINFEYNNSHYPKIQSNKNCNINIINGELENIKNNKKSSNFDLDLMLLTYPKLNCDRNVLQLTTHFLDAIVNDKIGIENIVTPETFDKLKESLIAQGMAFKQNENELDFDKEIKLLFDKATREKIKKLFKCIYSLF